MEHFDYLSVATQAGIPEAALQKICQRIRSEFPHDDLMYELHVLRVCIAIRDGLSRLDEVLDAIEHGAAATAFTTHEPTAP